MKKKLLFKKERSTMPTPPMHTLCSTKRCSTSSSATSTHSRAGLVALGPELHCHSPMHWKAM